MEAEFVAACDAGKTAKCLRFVRPAEIHIDDQAALQIANDNQCPAARTGHVDIRWFGSQN